MRIKVIGSGGCTTLPRPLCFCKVCVEAREKGRPFSRGGPALYIEDIQLLIDTPEDIANSLNYNQIEEINNVFYSHWDPDNTLGMRIFEQLRLSWLDTSVGIKNEKPINVFTLPMVYDDLIALQNKFGSFIDYYQNVHNLIKINIVSEELVLADIKITFVPTVCSTIFVFEQNNKKVVYAPCDIKPWPDNQLFNNADLLIVGDIIPTNPIKNDFYVLADNPLRQELFMIDEIIALKDRYKIKEIIITHIEEDWGLSYTDYLELEKQYHGIRFAYDGMEIEV